MPPGMDFAVYKNTSHLNSWSWVDLSGNILDRSLNSKPTGSLIQISGLWTGHTKLLILLSCIPLQHEPYALVRCHLEKHSCSEGNIVYGYQSYHSIYFWAFVLPWTLHNVHIPCQLIFTFSCVFVRKNTMNRFVMYRTMQSSMAISILNRAIVENYIHISYKVSFYEF